MIELSDDENIVILACFLLSQY